MSESVLVRDAVAALDWIRPPPDEVAILAGYAAAGRWIEARRGERRPVLAALLGEARGAARGPVSARFVRWC